MNCQLCESGCPVMGDTLFQEELGRGHVVSWGEATACWVPCNDGERAKAKAAYAKLQTTNHENY